MLTMRLMGLTLATALCGGCGTFTDQMTGAVNSTTRPRPAVFVGQPLDEAKKLLAETEAEDITHTIGVIIHDPGDHLWFQLRGGKWLYVRAVEAKEPKRFVIEKIVLGDDNTKHIKEHGLKGHRETARLDLP